MSAAHIKPHLNPHFCLQMDSCNSFTLSKRWSIEKRKVRKMKHTLHKYISSNIKSQISPLPVLTVLDKYFNLNFVVNIDFVFTNFDNLSGRS